MDRADYETLKYCIHNKDWCDSHDHVITVAHILKGYYIFDSTYGKDASINNVIDYFEKPWHWEKDILEIVKEYELEAIEDDFKCLTLDEAIVALDWLFEFGFELETVKSLENTIEELVPV